MTKLYACSLMATETKVPGRVHCHTMPLVVLAENEMEATGIAQKQAEAFYPPDLGYQNQRATVMEVPQNLIDCVVLLNTTTENPSTQKGETNG